MKARYLKVWQIGFGAGLMLIAVWFVAASHFVYAQSGKANAGVTPPNGKFRGLSYEDLEASFWQTLFSIPVVNGDHPLISGGPVAGPKDIVFLTAPFGGADIDLTISSGTGLFIPIVNTEVSEFEPDPFHGDTEEEQRELANAWIDGAYDLEATIDGKPVNNLAAHRFESEQFVWGPLPEDNLFAFFGLDAPAGTTSTAVDAGYYLLVTPLNVGEHEVHIHGVFDPFTPGDPEDDLVIDTTFNITVVAGHGKP